MKQLALFWLTWQFAQTSKSGTPQTFKSRDPLSRGLGLLRGGAIPLSVAACTQPTTWNLSLCTVDWVRPTSSSRSSPFLAAALRSCGLRDASLVFIAAGNMKIQVLGP